MRPSVRYLASLTAVAVASCTGAAAAAAAEGLTITLNGVEVAVPTAGGASSSSIDGLLREASNAATGIEAQVGGLVQQHLQEHEGTDPARLVTRHVEAAEQLARSSQGVSTRGVGSALARFSPPATATVERDSPVTVQVTGTQAASASEASTTALGVQGKSQLVVEQKSTVDAAAAVAAQASSDHASSQTGDSSAASEISSTVVVESRATVTFSEEPATVVTGQVKSVRAALPAPERAPPAVGAGRTPSRRGAREAHASPTQSATSANDPAPAAPIATPAAAADGPTSSKESPAAAPPPRDRTPGPDSHGIAGGADTETANPLFIGLVALMALFALAAPGLGRRLPLPPAIWRPLAVVSKRKRPG